MSENSELTPAQKARPQRNRILAVSILLPLPVAALAGAPLIAGGKRVGCLALGCRISGEGAV